MPARTRERRRQLWALLSERGHVPRRELAATLGVGLAVIDNDIRALERLGYIERPVRRSRALRVLVPLHPLVLNAKEAA